MVLLLLDVCERYLGLLQVASPPVFLEQCLLQLLGPDIGAVGGAGDLGDRQDLAALKLLKDHVLDLDVLHSTKPDATATRDRCTRVAFKLNGDQFAKLFQKAFARESLTSS